jgi:hypothetical protein
VSPNITCKRRSDDNGPNENDEGTNLPPLIRQQMAREAEEAGQTQSIWMEWLIASHIKAKAADQSGCSSE